MRLNDLKFVKLLPVFMRQEADIVALATAMDHALRNSNGHLQTASTWNAIDQLSEKELDDLAWEFDVDWYDSGASRESKVAQIQAAQRVKKWKGTKWAVEAAVKALVGQATVLEWPEWGGDPFTFKLAIKNASVTQDLFDRTLLVIDKVKNVRSIMTEAYYTEDHIVSLTIKAQEHTGPFFLPKCGCYRPTKVVRGSDLNLAHGVKVQEHIGPFILPRCGYYRPQEGGPVFGFSYIESHALSVAVQEYIGVVEYPICGLAVLGPVEVGGGLRGMVGIAVDEKFNVVTYPLCGYAELEKEGD